MANIAKVAAIIGISMASFTSMAQENPTKAIETVKAQISKASPEQLAMVNKETGIDFTEDGVNQLFDFSKKKDFEHHKFPDVHLGKYGKINVAKITSKNVTRGGGQRYIIDISDKRYIESGKVFRFIHSNNKNLDNTTIEFTYKDSPMPTKTITYN
tara:strand:- start:10441 stop:10908 length:468 start_codon:yes stop_codon:yes gene_type:complete